LGKIGKKKALKNVQKRLKIFENIRKRLKIFEKVCEIFENIQKFEQFFPPRICLTAENAEDAESFSDRITGWTGICF